MMATRKDRSSFVRFVRTAQNQVPVRVLFRTKLTSLSSGIVHIVRKFVRQGVGGWRMLHTDADSWEPVIVMPVQLVWSRPLHGEHLLALAVLKQAIADLQDRSEYYRYRRADAAAWIASTRRTGYGFIDLCEFLGLEPSRIRRALLRRDHHRGEPVMRQRHRERVACPTITAPPPVPAGVPHAV